MTYKCSICGYKARDIGGLSKHRSKAHPGAKKKKATRPVTLPEIQDGIPKFCQHCGGRI